MRIGVSCVIISIVILSGCSVTTDYFSKNSFFDSMSNQNDEVCQLWAIGETTETILVTTNVNELKKRENIFHKSCFRDAEMIGENEKYQYWSENTLQGCKPLAISEKIISQDGEIIGTYDAEIYPEVIENAFLSPILDLEVIDVIDLNYGNPDMKRITVEIKFNVSNITKLREVYGEEIYVYIKDSLGNKQCRYNVEQGSYSHTCSYNAEFRKKPSLSVHPYQVAQNQFYNVVNYGFKKCLFEN